MKSSPSFIELNLKEQLVNGLKDNVSYQLSASCGLS